MQNIYVFIYIRALVSWNPESLPKRKSPLSGAPLKMESLTVVWFYDMHELREPSAEDPKTYQIHSTVVRINIIFGEKKTISS